MTATFARREFIVGLGSAAAWPRAARAQQRAMPVIGYLSSSAADYDASTLVAFRRGLGDVGYTEGRNVAIEYRFADAHYDRLTVLAADLIHLKVRVIVAAAVNPAHAAKAATTTIPIVFSISGDPVAEGLVSNLNRLVGNLTGSRPFPGRCRRSG